MTGCEELSCRIDGRVAVVTLDRPEVKNALTLAMKRTLAALLPRLADDPAVGAVLLTGAGAAFCAGGDTKRMAREAASASTSRTRIARGSAARLRHGERFR